MDFSLHTRPAGHQGRGSWSTARGFRETTGSNATGKGSFRTTSINRCQIAAGWASPCRTQSGAGLGITEAAMMMQADRPNPGGGMKRRVERRPSGLQRAAGRAVRHRRTAAPHPPGGLEPAKTVICFAVTEPNAGLNHDRIPDPGGTARRRLPGERARKIWISVAQDANKMMLLARTTPLEEVTAQPKAFPRSHRPGPGPGRGPGDPQDGPACGRF